MKDIEAKVQVLFFKEDDMVIAYSPALDLSTSGTTEEMAHERFAEAVKIFLTEIAKMGTLEEVLVECGWHKEPDKGWQPPVYKSAEESVIIPTGV